MTDTTINELRGLYTREAAAFYLSLKPSTIDQLRRDGDLVAVKNKSKPAFNREELDRYRNSLPPYN